MNTKLAVKMEQIEKDFARALQDVPMASRAADVQDVFVNGNSGVCVRGSRFIWGVTKAEYCSYYNIV